MVVIEVPQKLGVLIVAQLVADEGNEVLMPGAALEGLRSTGADALTAAGAPVVVNTAALLREIGLAAPRQLGLKFGAAWPLQRQRAVEAWLSRMFELEQKENVIVNNESVAVTAAWGGPVLNEEEVRR